MLMADSEPTQPRQILVDFHSHTTRCCHASGSMEAYVEQALAKGIQEFGFSDHSHWMLHA